MVFSTPISNLFGSSPIKPLQEHLTKAVDCVALLDDFFSATFAEDWNKASALFEQITEAEHAADDLKKQLRLHLPKSLFMPVSRSDLLSLLAQQDQVANLAKDISGIVLGREMVIPKEMQSGFAEFVQSAIEAAKRALTAVNELDELLETGFTGQEVKFVQKLIRELDAQEQKVDKNERKLRHRLFKLEGELPPVNVMFLYSTIDNIGAIADTAERIGNRLELLIAK